MRDMGFTLCKVDVELWLRAALKPNGTKDYKYVLVYVDGILCVSYNPEAVMKTIGFLYEIKNGDVSEPCLYFGATSFPAVNWTRCWRLTLPLDSDWTNLMATAIFFIVSTVLRLILILLMQLLYLYCLDILSILIQNWYTIDINW